MKRATGLLAATISIIALSACGSTGGELATDALPSTTPSQDAAEVVQQELCPSASEAERIVTLWSLPIGTKDESDPEMFNFTLTNALSESVDVLAEDTDALPCVGQSELQDTLTEWSDMLDTTLEENRTATDAELQAVADLGNQWLDVIDASNVNFSIDPAASDIGN